MVHYISGFDFLNLYFMLEVDVKKLRIASLVYKSKGSKRKRTFSNYFWKSYRLWLTNQNRKNSEVFNHQLPSLLRYNWRWHPNYFKHEYNFNKHVMSIASITSISMDNDAIRPGNILLTSFPGFQWQLPFTRFWLTRNRFLKTQFFQSVILARRIEIQK